MSKTRIEAHEELNIAARKLLFEVCKSLGVIWFAKRVSFLELKPWVKELDEAPGHERNT